MFKGFSLEVIAGTTAIAAGAILSMVVDITISEALEEARDLAGLITVTGFFAAFVLSKLGG
jgi:ZIP family zinc transporter